ncbi:hypothetical protein MBLNU230_g5508t1 [Neophaeotheca triangularis]
MIDTTAAMADTKLTTPPSDVAPDIAPWTGPFRLMDLAAELREKIYFFAALPLTPIDTASIPGTPDFVKIPVIAQVNKQVREEALAVFSRKRSVQISLHSSQHFKQSMVWVAKHTDSSAFFSRIIFAGKLKYQNNNFFHITIDCLPKAPYFRAHRRDAATKAADQISHYIKHRILNYLDMVAEKAGPEYQAKLGGEQLFSLIALVKASSQVCVAQCLAALARDDYSADANALWP